MKLYLKKSYSGLMSALIGAALAMVSGASAQITQSGSFITYDSNLVFNVGTQSTDTPNSLSYLQLGSQQTLLNGGTLLIGSDGTGLASHNGGSFNVVTLSNVFMTIGHTSYVGAESSSNSLTLLANAVISGGSGAGQTLQVGFKPNQSFVMSNNVLQVLGGVVSNVIIDVGMNAGSGQTLGNSLIVSNGGFVQLYGLNIGFGTSGAVSSNNYVFINNANIGAGQNPNTGNLSIGNTGYSNTGILQNVAWDGVSQLGLGFVMRVGSGNDILGTSSNNYLSVSQGSAITNFGSILVGVDSYAPYGGLPIFTNNNNTLVVSGSNTLLSASGAMIVGGGDGWKRTERVVRGYWRIKQQHANPQRRESSFD